MAIKRRKTGKKSLRIQNLHMRMIFTGLRRKITNGHLKRRRLKGLVTYSVHSDRPQLQELQTLCLAPSTIRLTVARKCKKNMRKKSKQTRRSDLDWRKYKDKRKRRVNSRKRRRKKNWKGRQNLWNWKKKRQRL